MPFAIIRAVSNSFYKSRAWNWTLLCLTLLCFSGRRYWWTPWTSFALIGLSYTYLLLVNRVMDHVESGIWLFAVVFVLFFIDNKHVMGQKQTNRFFLTTCIVGIVGFILTATLFAVDNQSRNARIQKAGGFSWNEFLQYTKDRPDDVFLLPFERYMQLAECTGKTYKALPPHSLDNIYSTGYWNIYLPPMEQELKKRGVSNLFYDIKNENVYVVNDKYSLSFAPFYSEHYHEILVADTIKSFGSITLLKYRIKEHDDE